MSFARISLSLVGVVGIIAVALAGATIWLLVTQPVTTADAIGAAAQGEVSPLVKALAGALYDALQGLLKYLEPDTELKLRVTDASPEPRPSAERRPPITSSYSGNDRASAHRAI